MIQAWKTLEPPRSSPWEIGTLGVRRSGSTFVEENVTLGSHVPVHEENFQIPSNSKHMSGIGSWTKKRQYVNQSWLTHSVLNLLFQLIAIPDFPAAYVPAR